MSAPKPSIVIFPGAWHPASCMAAFTRTLGDEGFDAHAFTLPSATSDASKGMRDDEEAMRRAILSVVNTDKDVLFIVHSYAGFPGAGVLAELAKANRVAKGLRNGIVGVIYMASFIPLEGQSIYECLGGKWQPFMALDGEGIGSVNRQHTFYNDCEEEVAKAMGSVLGVQSVKSFMDKVEVAGWRDRAYEGHRAYIRCLRDNAIAIQGQDALIQASEVEWVIKTLDASHSPFLSMPKDLAKVVSEIHEQFSIG